MSEDAYGPGYRRGLVLGLTLAEVFLLLLFLILLLSAFLIETAAEKERIVNEALQEIGVSTEDEALPSKLVAISKDAAYGRQARKIMQGASDEALPRMLEACGDPKAVKEILEESFKGQTAEQALDVCSSIMNPEKDAEGVPTLESLDDAKAVVRRLTAENLKLRDQLAGNGLELPPCWPRKQNLLRPVYTYDVTVVDEGLNVKLGDDRQGQDLNALKVNGIEPSYERVTAPEEFLNKTRGLYDWSVENRCRFFVRLYDGTSPTNKAGYKKFRRTVEGHFYIADIR